MERQNEKKSFQASCPMQQKVFKFHNVSKDVILGNKKAKKDGKRNTKKLPPDKIRSRNEVSKEKMAQLIFKQYIPIRQKCLPVVNSQTKKHMETINLVKSKKSLTFGSKSCFLERNENKDNKTTNKLEQPITPHKDTLEDLEKPPGIRLVDISLLKEPKNDLDISLENVHEQERIGNETLLISPKRNSAESMDQSVETSNYAWTSSPVFTNEDDDVPLDLSKKRKPPEPPNEEQYPLDLSKNNKNYQYTSAGEPPPLVPIQHKCSAASPPVLGIEIDLNIAGKRVEQPVQTSSQNKIITLDCSQKQSSPNQSTIGIPQILKLQPIQVVFTTNPVLHEEKTQTICRPQIFPDQQLSPVTKNGINDSTREQIKTKLSERLQNKPKPVSQVTDVTTSLASMVQPIQMVFTDGKFVQVLPSQNIPHDISEPTCSKPKKSSLPSKANEIRIVKKPRKRKSPNEGIQASLTAMLQPLSIQNMHHGEGLAANTYDPPTEYPNKTNNNNIKKNFNQSLMIQNMGKIDNSAKTSVVSQGSMVKTNEMVTSNGGVFCTFKNVNRIKPLKTKSKARRKRAKPDQSVAMNTNN